MKPNETVMIEQENKQIRSEIEEGRYNPRTREIEKPPTEAEVVHSPNAF